MIKPWIFEFFHSFEGEDIDDEAKIQDRYQRYLKMWTRDEELGYEGIFFSEHHFGPAYGPSPHLLIANMACRTKTLRLGTIGAVAGYMPPWRFVEEMGMLDHLTEGRLEFGLVRGILPEMSAVGISADVANARFDEALDLIDQAVQAKGPFSFHGKEWNFEDVRIIPRFLQKPSPPRWTAVVHPASAERAARHGWKICLGFSSSEDMRQIADLYHRSGKNTSPDDIAIRRRVVFVKNEGEIAAARAMAREDQNKTVEASRSLAPKTPDAPPPNPRVPPPDDEFIAGTPEMVAAEIIRQCRLVGAANFVVNLYTDPNEQGITESHEVFGREVIPALRSAGLT